MSEVLFSFATAFLLLGYLAQISEKPKQSQVFTPAVAVDLCGSQLLCNGEMSHFCGCLSLCHEEERGWT